MQHLRSPGSTYRSGQQRVFLKISRTNIDFMLDSFLQKVNYVGVVCPHCI